MTIRKGKMTLEFVFMFDDNIDTEESVRNMSLEDLQYEITEGHMLGQFGLGHAALSIEAVPNDQVAAEEIALGCDGTFFADPDELEHARMNAAGENE